MLTNLLLLLASSLISPFSLIASVIVMVNWLALWKLVGKERAFVTIWIGILLFWILMVVSYIIFSGKDSGEEILMGVPFQMHLKTTNGLETTLSDIRKENLLPYFLDFLASVWVSVLVSKKLTVNLYDKKSGFSTFYYAMVGTAMLASLIGTFFIAAFIS